MKRLYLLGLVTMLFPTSAWAQNPNGSLAIHLVASDEYLDCSNLCPQGMTCEDVDCDLSLMELEASGGHAHAAFVAYNIENVAALEFFVVGWPTAPGAPAFSGPQYCPTGVQWLGEPFEARGGHGGFLSFPFCQEPCSAIFCFCSIAVGPDTYGWLPITIDFAPSSFSSSADAHSYFIDCSTSWVVSTVFYEHPAVIGGTCDPIPNCEPGPTGNDGNTWGGVKELYR